MRGVGAAVPRFVLLLAALAVVGCGGGGGGGSSSASVAVPATAAPALPASQTVSVAAGSAAVVTPFTTLASGATGSVTLQSASSSATVGITFASALPASVPVVQSVRRMAAAIGAPVTTYAFFTFTPSATIAFSATPGFGLTLASGTLLASASYYAAVYSATSGWTAVIGPETATGSSVVFPSALTSTTFTAGSSVTYVLFSTASPLALSTPTPSPSPGLTASPLATPGPPLAYMTAIATNTFASGIATTSKTGIVIDISQALETSITAASPALPTDQVSVKAGTSATLFALGEAPMRGRTAVTPSFTAPPLHEIMTPERDAEMTRFVAAASHVTNAQTLALRRTQALPVTAGATNAFTISTAASGSSTNSTTLVPATLGAISAHGYIWIDNTLSLSAQAIAAIGTDFDNAYASDTAHFASPEYTTAAPGATAVEVPCDSTGMPVTGATPGPVFIPPPNGMHAVVVVNVATLGSGVGGYFSGLNHFTQGAANCFSGQPVSNQASMIVVGYNTASTQSYELQEDLVRGTAHELQHDINFVQHEILRPVPFTEASWLNEGLSMLAQDLAVHRLFPTISNDVDDALTRARQFLTAPSQFSVTGFTGIDTGSTFATGCSGCYGAEFLFQRYLYDRFGGDSYLNAMETSATVGLSNLQQSTGVAPKQLIADFALAVVNSGSGISTDSRYTFTNFNPYGTYLDQFGRQLVFTGPSVFTSTPGTTLLVTSYLGTFHYVQIASGGAGAGITVADPSGAFALAAGLLQF